MALPQQCTWGRDAEGREGRQRWHLLDTHPNPAALQLWHEAFHIKSNVAGC